MQIKRNLNASKNILTTLNDEVVISVKMYAPNEDKITNEMLKISSPIIEPTINFV